MKRKLITIISTLLACLFALGIFAGCDFVSVNNRRDMEQVVATVNISNDETALGEMFGTLFGEDFEWNEGVKNDLSNIVSTDEVYKRDLIAYFINYGYNYISSGSSYGETFDLLMDTLVSRKIMVQYAIIYYLNEGQVVVDRDSVDKDLRDQYPSAGEGSEGVITKSGLTAEGYLAAKNTEGLSEDERVVESLKYFLTDEEIKLAEYTLRVTVNNAIDSYEEEIIAQESGSDTSGTETDRTTPTGANETKETYYPKTSDGGIDYDIYTGSNKVSDCGEYEKVDGSTPISRKKAYNRFISSLKSNYLVESGENTSDFYSLGYYDVELKTQFEQTLINKFMDTLSVRIADQLSNDELNNRYTAMLGTQKTTADSASSSEFTTTMDSMSDSSFVLYSPSSGYGFVYNILLPFSSSQSNYLTAIKNSNTESAYLTARNAMLLNITATDQRSSWFNGSEDYSYKAEAGSYYDNGNVEGDRYLFFEDSYTKGDGIDKYYGQYPYNGEVSKDGDTYTLVPNKITIKDFMDELSGYLAHVDSGLTLTGNYVDDETFRSTDFTNEDGDLDYSQAIYYRGAVNLGTVDYDNFLNEESSSYKAISAVNELMFAYSTDTGCFNTYLGYSIAAEGYTTSYVEEFRYAAQQAIKEGAGTVYVVGTDFGWHILYVSMTLSEGEIYDGYNPDEKSVEGTFSYNFYQSVKSAALSEYTSDMQNRVLEILNNDTIVKLYESRYSDLSNLG